MITTIRPISSTVDLGDNNPPPRITVCQKVTDAAWGIFTYFVGFIYAPPAVAVNAPPVVAIAPQAVEYKPPTLKKREILPIRYRNRDELLFDPTRAPESPLSRQRTFDTSPDQADRSSSPTPLPNGGNTCFFAALTQAFLNDPEILEALKIAGKRAEGKEGKGLRGIYQYLMTYRKCQKEGIPVPGEATNEVRKSLKLLGLVGEGDVQQDAEEALMAIMGSLVDHLPEDIALFHSRQWTLDKLDTLRQPISWIMQIWYWIFGAPPEPVVRLEEADKTVVDAERKIFWEPPQANWGKIELFFGPTDDFASMVQSYFFEDKSGDGEPRRRNDSEGVEQEFSFASKRTAFESAPERLSISFKRFNAIEKIETEVQGIRDVLELGSDYFLDGQEAAYRIDGAVIHQGNNVGGHYLAVRRTIDEEGNHHYFYCSDETVNEISQEKFLGWLPQSYNLFLKKI